MAKSEIKDVFSHEINNDALVVSNLVLKIDDPLILEVSIEHVSEISHLKVELFFITIVFIVMEAGTGLA